MADNALGAHLQHDIFIFVRWPCAFVRDACDPSLSLTIAERELSAQHLLASYLPSFRQQTHAHLLGRRHAQEPTTDVEHVRHVILSRRVGRHEEIR